MILTGVDSIDIIELLNFFLDTLKFAYPILLLLIPIPIIRYICKRIKKYSQDKKCEIQEKNKKKKQINKTNNERRKNINKFYKDKDKMLKKLDDISEPIDKSKYRDLNIYFDKNGKAKL